MSVINAMKKIIDENIKLIEEKFTPTKFALYTIMIFFITVAVLPYVLYISEKLTNITFFYDYGKSVYSQLENTGVANKNYLSTVLFIFLHNLKIASILMFSAPFIVFYFLYILYVAIVSSIVLYYVGNSTPKMFSVLSLSLVPHGLFELSGIAYIVWSGLYLYRKDWKNMVKHYLIGAGLLLLAAIIESIPIVFSGSLNC